MTVIKDMRHTIRKIVRRNNEEFKEFEIKKGLKQGCVLSSLLFSVVVNEAIKRAKKKTKPLTMGYWRLGVNLTELMFADINSANSPIRKKPTRKFEMFEQ